MKKSAIILIVAAILGIAVILAIFLFRTKDMAYAIDQFDDGDYEESIIVINRLIPLADYETGEKLYYFRARALNRLASELVSDYDDELVSAALDKKGTSGFEKYRKKIERKLENINRATNGDLAVIILPGKSHIASRGMYYQEFVNKYRGSGFIQDLDFEELEKVERTSPEKVPEQAIAFFRKYPGTPYIAQLVRMIMDSLEKGSVDITRNGESLLTMLGAYSRRYPSSEEVARIFKTKGDKVNLRASAGVSGQMVGKLPAGETVIQLERSMNMVQVGDTRDYWYRIVTLKGVQGWVFGKFLEQMDPSELAGSVPAEDIWNLNENFSEWTDSHTPRNWVHMAGANRDSIIFTGTGEGTVAIVTSPKGGTSGLYSRYQTTSAFEAAVRTRLRAGDGFTPVILSLGGNGYYLKLTRDMVDVCTRTIPMLTNDWHEYTLKSDNGKYVSLYIDGELVAGRIPPVSLKEFPGRGIYCLVSSVNEASEGEVKFLKVR